MNPQQASMFGNDDLPLFSGTAQRVSVNPFESKPAHRQESFATCRLCADTGKLGDMAYCSCEAGQQAQRDRHNCQDPVETLSATEGAKSVVDDGDVLTFYRASSIPGKYAQKVVIRNPNGGWRITEPWIVSNHGLPENALAIV